jgi:hypothetical protein
MKISDQQRPYVTFHDVFVFHGKELLDRLLNPKMDVNYFFQ